MPSSQNTYMVGIHSVADYSPFGVELDGRTQSGVGYRYSFQGQEKDDEIKGEGNSINTFFRQYDPRVCRWLSIDPLNEKYADVSPYVAFVNSPLIFVDTKGDSIKQFIRNKDAWIVKGWLQTLTNDKLTVDTKGNIVIEKMGVANPGKNLSTGTALVRDLISNENTVTINLNSRGVNNATFEIDNARDETKGADFVIVNFDRFTKIDFLTINPSSGKIEESEPKNEIILAHELIHAYYAMTGRNKSDKISSHSYKKADGNTYKETGSSEELETVGVTGKREYTENKIRKEQGEGKRVKYGG